VEASKEKHIPVVEKVAEGWKVKVGRRRPPDGGEALHRLD